MHPYEVRALRRALGWTQQRLAFYLGLRRDCQVSHLETGRTRATGAKEVLLLQLLANLDPLQKRHYEQYCRSRT